MVLFAFTVIAWAQGTPNPQDKGRYNLLNPTPKSLMREMSTDRPDQTESAYTVDAGHIQIEMDLANLTRDREFGELLNALSLGASNFRIGLFNNLELDLIFDTYAVQWSRQVVTGQTEQNRGIGDFQTRVKINLWGNDQGSSSLAIMPFIKCPTAQHGLGNESVEGGIILPMSIGLSDRFSLGMMSQVAWLRDENGIGYRSEWVNSASLGIDLSPRFGVYAELFAAVSPSQNSDWQGQFDFGMTCSVKSNLQLDAGLNVGFTRSAPDFQPFLGLSWRF